MMANHPKQEPATPEETMARRERQTLLRATVLESGVMVILGAAALIFPLVASMWLTGVVALVFLVAGLVTGMATAVRARRLSGVHAFWRLLLATLLVVAGLWMLRQLTAGPGTASRQVGILGRGAGLVFLVEGLATSLFTLNHRGIRGWGWGLVNGVGTLALGALSLLLPLARLPWLLGILVGMSFVFSGLDLLLFGSRFDQDLTRGPP